MILSEIIGLKISKIRFSYQFENEYGMQEFHSYIKLSNGKIINIPKFPDDSANLSKIYEDSKECSFFNAKRCGIASRVLFKNKRIIDVHFKYLDGEHFEGSSGIMELENGVYITENNYGPIGLTDIDLQILTRKQFAELRDSNDEIEIRSFSNSNQ